MVRSKAIRHVEDAAMPSPFPGMNPYIEAMGLWPGVHLRLVEGIGTAINGAAPERYFTDVDERVYLCDTDDIIHAANHSRCLCLRDGSS